MKNAFLILLILFSFTRCAEPCDTCGDGKIMENYVLKYYTHTNYSNLFVDTPSKDSFDIKFEVHFYGGELINSILPENEEMLAEFRDIAKYNGDTSYYQPISTCFPYTCLSYEAGQFNISCDMEYAGYPAETSLNELFTIYYYSAEDFVRGGYVTPDINMPIEQYCKPLIEFNAGKYNLVASNHIYLVLNIKPDYPAEYMFTFTYYSDSSGEMVDVSYLLYDIK
jgi:hypothetical protein